MHQFGFDDVSVSYARLDAAGDSLARLDAVVDWTGLDAVLSAIRFEDKGKGGRPPLSARVMAKVFLLQAFHNLSDGATEYLINDRLSFKRFLGLELSQKAPDEKTMWLWRERMIHGGVYEKIFAWFDGTLEKAGYQAQKGQIVDATFVPTHKPTGKHNKQMAQEIPLTPAQARQIDTDATFTKKSSKHYHGYKNHTVIDNKHKLIRSCEVTTASVHDSQELDALAALMPEDAPAEDRGLWGDSAYRSVQAEAMLEAKGLVSHVHERAYRNTPLTEEQKSSNALKSKTRARVEHVYGHVVTSMGGWMIHTMGLARAKMKITFKNLAYNMQRFVWLESRKRQESCA